jgi:hypothetical protein
MAAKARAAADRTRNLTPLWVGKEFARMAKVIANHRGQTIGDVVTGLFGPALAREYRRALAEMSAAAGEG